jgi:hypothetical protein
MKPLSLAEQLSALETAREEGAKALLPTTQASIHPGFDREMAEESLVSARAQWDLQNPRSVAIMSVLRMTVGQMKAQEDLRLNNEWDAFCKAVSEAEDVDLVPIEDFSPADISLLDHAGVVLNGGTPPTSFLNELHADGPLRESSTPDRFAELLALRFIMSFCVLSYNPNPKFQESLRSAAFEGDGAHVKLRSYATNSFRRYVTFLEKLPDVTAVASLKHFVRISESEPMQIASAPYCDSVQDPADRAPGYNVARDVLASVVMAEARAATDEKYARLLASYLMALMPPVAVLDDASGPTLH